MGKYLLNILIKYFFSTTCIVKCLVFSNLHTHTHTLSVAKGLRISLARVNPQIFGKQNTSLLSLLNNALYRKVVLKLTNHGRASVMYK